MRKYKVTDVAKILEVEKDTIKKWTYDFSEYLSKYASPPKGEERKFTTEDIYTLRYVEYWEDGSDLENIKFGLNAGEQFNSPYNSFINDTKPIFHEFDEEDVVNTKSWIIGGMADNWNRMNLADSYKKAADLLIEQGINDENNYDIAYPTLYTYRHSIELYLKAIIELNLEKYALHKSHSLRELYKLFEQIIQEKFSISPPKWFEGIIKELHEFEAKGELEGTNFRYGIPLGKDEFLIDLYHIKERMTCFKKSIHNISSAMK